MHVLEQQNVAQAHAAHTAAMPAFHHAARQVNPAVQLAGIAIQEVTNLPVLVQLAERLVVGQSQPQPRSDVLPNVLQQQRTHLNIDRGIPLSLQQDMGWCGYLGLNASKTEDPSQHLQRGKSPWPPLQRSSAQLWHGGVAKAQHHSYRPAVLTLGLCAGCTPVVNGAYMHTHARNSGGANEGWQQSQVFGGQPGEAVSLSQTAVNLKPFCISGPQKVCTGATAVTNASVQGSHMNTTAHLCSSILFAAQLQTLQGTAAATFKRTAIAFEGSQQRIRTTSRAPRVTLHALHHAADMISGRTHCSGKALHSPASAEPAGMIPVGNAAGSS